MDPNTVNQQAPADQPVNNQQASLAPSSPPLFTIKKLFVVLGVVVLVIVIAGIGIKLLPANTKQSISTSMITPTKKPRFEDVMRSTTRPNVLPTSSKETDCADNSLDWKQYSDPGNRFLIDYPISGKIMMEPHATVFGKESEPLIIQLQFTSDNPLYTKFGGLYFWIYVWQNQNRLTPEAWAKQNSDAHFITLIRPISVAGREGVTFNTNIMVGASESVYVADKDLMYGLQYTHLSEQTVPVDIRACWVSVSSKMLGSFTFL